MNEGVAQQSFMHAVMGAIAQAVGAVESPLDPCANLRLFTEKYGLRIDGKKVDWLLYKHLAPVAEDNHLAITLMAGAQTGKSALIMAALARYLIVHWGAMFGYYFPDYLLPRAFSDSRWAPFVAGSPELRPWLGRSTLTRKGKQATLTRTFGPSTAYFLSVKGKTATEGMPFQGVFFDEVRKMEIGDVERAMERTSAQTNAIDWKASTARYPETDIHHWFLQGDQRWFHTMCGCSDGITLSRAFPECIADLKGATPLLKGKVAHAFSHAGLPYLGMSDEDRRRYGEAVYVCPKCGQFVIDPREGYWEPENSAGYAHSYQMPQCLTPAFSAARLLDKYKNAQDMQEFYNSGLGLPYIDPEARALTEAHLIGCVDSTLEWPAHWPAEKRKRLITNTAMGVDVQAGYNVCKIKIKAPNGKHRTVHAQVVHGDDPWAETARLMYDWDVRICVVDGEPHWNEAFRFAKHFQGRVWVADENERATGSPMVSWKDASKQPMQKGETRMRHSVLIDRSRGLRWALGRYRRRENEMPDPRTLMQPLPQVGDKVVMSSGLARGQFVPSAIMRQVVWPQLLNIVFRKITASEESERLGRVSYVAEAIGRDDFAHADMFASVALARMGQPTGDWTDPDEEPA